MRAFNSSHIECCSELNYFNHLRKACQYLLFQSDYRKWMDDNYPAILEG